ncbi:PLP-dependent aminotransferase family protein [Phytoactinopolyspora mesophila]|uniref:Aminotransferase class I/II-fold pyridoxal phosphate-dependent enzyme n=1 Tax=Phytoactinopolyspora mesophila TaxID=2650750 RepID=A0A7K3M9T2_9ACTN|nr:PLP-dependent aminotransferase family protein [Phytoactinopolyspora mesophila]NDL59168.1 aminotransferase class I/II-fold pyridoxal phosphate-dependent enzyme [Phytoactinopolyspora mesophila]
MIAWSQHAASRTSRLRPSAIREILKLTQRGEVISFAGGLPAPDLFPVAAIREASERILSKRGAVSLQYSTTEGDPELRAWVASRYAGVRPEGVQIVSGSQQGLDLVGKCYLDPGDVVAVAAPTYPGALRAFEAYEVRFRAVEIDEDGMVPESLAEALESGVKLIYVIPDFDNPTGATLSLPRRHAIVDLARAHGVPILEDSPYSDLRFEGDPLPYLVDLAPDVVIHAGTFSKTMVPGFRLAWLAATPEALAPVTRAKQAADLHTSTFTQMLALEVARGGSLDGQIAKVCEHYGSRRDIMLAALDRELAGVSGFRWTRPHGGMFIWVSGPDEFDTTSTAHAAIEAGVAYVPGEAFYADRRRTDGLRLSYSVASPEQIEVGIARLAAIFRAA